MPQISRFFGIIISMFFREHNPPHFHANYEGFNAEISIQDFSIIDGSLPPRIYGLVVEWAAIHKAELEQNWKNYENDEPFNKIEPLI